MKRVISVLMSLIIIMTGTLAFAADMDAQFSISAIKNDYDKNELTMNITLPAAVDGGTLIIALYTEGVCTKVIARDVSSINTIELKKETFSITPDTIKLMLWEKGRIRPLSSAQNGLSSEVYQYANKNVLKLLNDLTPTTKAIRALLAQYSNKDDKDAEARIKSEITNLLNTIDTCAEKALQGDYGNDELLTAEYCKREFKEELDILKNLVSKTSDDAKNLLISYHTKLLDDVFPDEGYSQTITNFLGFFNIKLN